MIRLGILSDTHRELGAGARAIKQMGSIDCLLHGGDHYGDARELARLTKVPVEAVNGNCDWFSIGGPEELVLQFEKVRILLTHGHRYRVKSGYELLLERALQLGVTAAVFGHTHQACLRWEKGVLLFNPGSPASPRGGKPTFGILTVDGDTVNGELLELNTD
ncbi:MAG: metallophosphoesterase [Clostridia bacterium]|nr:metallophosphoesterase [Clostridia bacterium]